MCRLSGSLNLKVPSGSVQGLRYFTQIINVAAGSRPTLYTPKTTPELAEQSIAIYQTVAASCLVSIKIYLPPQYNQQLFV